MRTNSCEKPRVAIVHDWLLGFRGGEQVLDALLEAFPSAEVFTLFYKKGSQTALIEERPIHASWLNSLPAAEKYYRYLLPLMPLTIERFNLKGFDLILSSSHCVAKGIIPPPDSLHICYCHSPMRYVWDKYGDYFKSGIVEKMVFPWSHYLRNWDQSSSQRVDFFLANSQLTQRRIEKYYRRSSEVLYPFVNLDRFKPVQGDRGDYYLIVSAFAPYKRIDLAIEACEKLGRKLYIVGSGQDAAHLKKLAKKNTTFLGKVSDLELSDLYAGAKALLFPGEEDFGIAPLEAMASGTPVIAYGRGGVTETVQDTLTGLFFPFQTVDSLSQAIEIFELGHHKITSSQCAQRATLFSRENFRKGIQETVERLWEEHINTGDLPKSPPPVPSTSKWDATSP